MRYCERFLVEITYEGIEAGVGEFDVVLSKCFMCEYGVTETALHVDCYDVTLHHQLRWPQL